MPPTTTARGTPTGKKLRNGHPTKLAFALLPAANFWEVTTGVPGVDGGPEVNNTTMHNVLWETMIPGALLTLSPFDVDAAWDPNFYGQCSATLINKNGSVTVHLPDGSTIDFFGFLQKMVPQPLKKNEFPMVKLTIVPTNTDPTTYAEAAPVVTEVVGT